jgi:hypothetical protein
MIDKLYQLKQKQINQQVLQKQQLINKVELLDKELEQTIETLNNASVKSMGSISDFRVLEIHKQTLKDHMVKIGEQKMHYLKQIEHYNMAIVDLNKQSEQFLYILQEEKKKRKKEIMKLEELASAEYMQSKFIQEKRYGQHEI